MLTTGFLIFIFIFSTTCRKDKLSPLRTPSIRMITSSFRRLAQRTIGSVDPFIGDAYRRFHASSRTKESANGDDHQQPEGHRACNQEYKGILQIKETPNKGLGLFASRDFAIGDLVMSSKPTVVTETRDSHSVQIDWNRHILMDLPAVLINHSCDANVGIQNNKSNESYDFWAIRPITKGEELTWDYEASEWELSTPFDCSCGSSNCRKRLEGFKMNGDIIREQYGEYYADYLKRDRQ